MLSTSRLHHRAEGGDGRLVGQAEAVEQQPEDDRVGGVDDGVPERQRGVLAGLGVRGPLQGRSTAARSASPRRPLRPSRPPGRPRPGRSPGGPARMLQARRRGRGCRRARAGGGAGRARRRSGSRAPSCCRRGGPRPGRACESRWSASRTAGRETPSTSASRRSLGSGSPAASSPSTTSPRSWSKTSSGTRRRATGFRAMPPRSPGHTSGGQVVRPVCRTRSKEGPGATPGPLFVMSVLLVPSSCARHRRRAGRRTGDRRPRGPRAERRGPSSSSAWWCASSSSALVGFWMLSPYQSHERRARTLSMARRPAGRRRSRRPRTSGVKTSSR